MNNNRINQLRHCSRILIRELGILQLNQYHSKKTPQHWHALTEIDKNPGITISKLCSLLLLSTSAASRVVNGLLKDNLATYRNGVDKREKYLQLTKKGEAEVAYINEFSNSRIKGAFEFLKQDEQEQIIAMIEKYGQALEKSRLLRENVKILTLSTSRTIRKQIIAMIENIQINQLLVAITPEINACIIKAEEHFYFNNACCFWYAIASNGNVIGSIGLKKIDAHNAEVKKLFVTAEYRGKGISQKLLTTLVKAAHKHHFSYLYLGTVGQFKPTLRFYEKYGFSRITKKQLPKNFDICPLDKVFFQVKTQHLLDQLNEI